MACTIEGAGEALLATVFRELTTVSCPYCGEEHPDEARSFVGVPVVVCPNVTSSEGYVLISRPPPA